MEGPQLVAGIARDVDALAALLGSLPRAVFALPTPCAAWDVTHLLAHLYRDFERIPDALAAPTTDPADTDRLSYWSYDRPETQVRTQDRARAIVERFGSPGALLPAFSHLCAGALAQAAAAVAGTPAQRVRLPWGPVMEFDEFLATRWLELVVHAQDVGDAVGRDPGLSSEGLAFTARILDGLAGAALSDRVSWSHGDYIRAATGRKALTSADFGALRDEVAARFPLIA